MSSMMKSAAAVALFSTLAVGSAQACMPMPTQARSPACAPDQAAAGGQQACPVQGRAQEPGCAGNRPDMAAMMGSMASGGMQMAMSVMGAMFGAPAEPAE